MKEIYLKEVFTFWDKLNEKEKNILIECSYEANYKKGQFVHNMHQECSGILLIKNGSLRVYIQSEDGREVTLYHLTKNDVCTLSSSCIMKEITFDVMIEAEKDSELIICNATCFDKLIESNIYVENFIYKQTTEKFSEVMWTMQQVLFLSFDKRLAGFLVDEAIKNNSDLINMTHEQIAKNLGSAREVVSRMLKYFETDNLVIVKRGTVKIVDREKLREISTLY